MASTVETISIERPDTLRVPGPKGHPIIGVAFQLRRDPLKYFMDSLLNYGDIVSFRVGTNPILMLNNPNDIKHVLQDNHANYHKSRFYKPLKPMLGNGIFLSEDESWLRQRRTASPAFGGSRFDYMAQQVIGATQDMLEIWKHRYDDGQSFNLMFEMMRLTLDAVTRAFLDFRLTDEHSDVHNALAVILKETERRVWSVARLPDDLYAVTRRTYYRALLVLEDLIRKLVEDRQRRPRDTGDLLSILMREHSGSLNSKHQGLIRDQGISIITAGHETTAIALAWVYYLISKHPNVGQRLYDEVDRVLGGRQPSLTDLDDLKYTRMVIEETMRLYPPVWTISRMALDDDKIGPVDIPKGVTVMLSPYAVHRHPGIWDNPEGFDPERFLPENVAQRPRYAYFPFGGGPRVCLGQRFAIMEAQLILAMIAQSYRIQLVPGQTVLPRPMITLRPREAIRVTLRKRQRLSSDLNA